VLEDIIKNLEQAPVQRMKDTLAEHDSLRQFLYHTIR